MDERSVERRRMVEQFVTGGLRNEAVLTAMRSVPREAFIAAELAEFA
jgi:protein-L-isoaspartate O-methyltransferase